MERFRRDCKKHKRNGIKVQEYSNCNSEIMFMKCNRKFVTYIHQSIWKFNVYYKEICMLHI